MTGRRTRPGLSRLPITLRIGGAFAALFLLAVAIIGVTTYLRVDSSLRAGIDEALVAALPEIRDDLPRADDADEEQVNAVSSIEVESQTMDQDGRVLDASIEELDADALLTPEQLEQVKAGDAVFTDSARAGEPMRVLATRVEEGDIAVLAVAAELDPVIDAREAYLALLGPLGLASALFAGGIGWLVARRALRPVAQMTAEAADIGATNMSRRLAVPPADDEIAHLGETLNHMLERLEHALQRERDFTADASHELRTPLAIIRAELELCLPRTHDPETRASLVSALEECERLGDLTNDLLLIARAEANQLDNRVPTDLGDLADTVVARFAALARSRGIELHRHGDAVIEADARGLDRALSNLVDNAVRHVGDGGSVRVEVRDDPDGVVLSVSDDGPGIPIEERDQLLGRFARSRTPPGRAEESTGGAGLGLSIVAAVAKAHGGTLELDEGRGGGLTATMRLRRVAVEVT